MRARTLATLLVTTSACIDVPAYTGTEAPDLGAITVNVRHRDGNVAQSQRVFFVDVDGTLRGETTTDGFGDATGEVQRGGTVYVDYAGATAMLIGITDVAPGDHLDIGRQPDPDRTGATTPLDYPESGVNGVMTYLAQSRCGFASAPTAAALALPVADRCGDAEFGLNVMALTEEPRRIERYIYQRVAAGAASYTSTGPWLVPDEIAVLVTGSGVANISAYFEALDAGERIGGTSVTDITAANGMFAAQGTYLPIGDELHEVVLDFTADVPTYGNQRLVQRTTRSDRYLQSIGPGVRAPFVTVPTGTETVQWRAEPDLAQVLVLDGKLVSPDGTETRTVRWILPGTATELALPALPGPLAALGPQPGMIPTWSLIAVRTDGDQAYADLRGIADRATSSFAELGVIPTTVPGVTSVFASRSP